MLSSHNQPLVGLDFIRFSGLHAFGRHGVYDSERENGQEFIVDADLFTDVRQAASSGELSDTFDYSEVATRVKAIIEGRIHNLIEEVAEAIAQDLLAINKVKAVRVCLHKPHAPIDAKFDDVSITIWRGKVLEDVGDRDVSQDECEAVLAGADGGIREVPEIPHRVIVALGANLGDPVGTLTQAIAQIETLEGVDLEAIGSLIQSRAVLAEGQDPQPDYFNTVIAIRSALAPLALLKEFQGLEEAFGRVRAEHWGARTLDIDIIDIEGIVSEEKELTIPHPLAHQRAFVLAPWAEFAPETVLGSYGNIVELAEQAPDADGVVDGWTDWYTPEEAPEQDSTLIVPTQDVVEGDAVEDVAQEGETIAEPYVEKTQKSDSASPKAEPTPALPVWASLDSVAETIPVSEVTQQPRIFDDVDPDEDESSGEEGPRKFASRRERRQHSSDGEDGMTENVETQRLNQVPRVADPDNHAEAVPSVNMPAPSPESEEPALNYPAPSLNQDGQQFEQGISQPVKRGFWHKLSAWLTSTPEEYNREYPLDNQGEPPLPDNHDNAAPQAQSGHIWRSLSAENASFEPGFTDEEEFADSFADAPVHTAPPQPVAEDDAVPASEAKTAQHKVTPPPQVVQRKPIMQNRAVSYSAAHNYGSETEAYPGEQEAQQEDDEHRQVAADPDIAHAQKIAQTAGDIKSQIVRPTTTGSIPIVKKKSD